jgi:hypothetical protein
MTIEHIALATAGVVIFLILALMSRMSRKQCRFDKQLSRMQSDVSDLRVTESRRFLTALNAGKPPLAQPGVDTAPSPVAEVPAVDAVEGPEVIPLMPVAARR